VTDPAQPPPRRRRRDPAWAWYLAAGALLLAMLVADLSGLLDPLIP
jgi:hypothetical protein